MRLAPGSTGKEHSDHDLAFENGTVRIHIPVVSNAGVDFRLNGTCRTMPAASSRYPRLSDPHSVANGGAGERVHLVIDAVFNDWAAMQIARALTLPAGTAGERQAPMDSQRLFC
jgi:Aspartyl/Asparaginyl beta-hydroxylase